MPNGRLLLSRAFPDSRQPRFNLSDCGWDMVAPTGIPKPSAASVCKPPNRIVENIPGTTEGVHIQKFTHEIAISAFMCKNVLCKPSPRKGSGSPCITCAWCGGFLSQSLSGKTSKPRWTWCCLCGDPVGEVLRFSASGRGLIHLRPETQNPAERRGLGTVTISRLLWSCHRRLSNLPSTLGLKAR